LQGGYIDMLKLRNSAWAHEGLETDYTAFGKFLKPVQVGGGEAAVKGKVGTAARRRRSVLGIKSRAVKEGWVRVQGHVYEAGPPARGKRRRPGSYAFPAGAPGLVKVHMCINDAGENREAASIKFFSVGTGGTRSGSGASGAGGTSRTRLGDHLGYAPLMDEHIGAFYAVG